MQCRARIEPAANILKTDQDVVIYNDPNPVDHHLAQAARARLKIFYVLELYEKNLLNRWRFDRYFPWHRRMRVMRQCLDSADLILANATWEKQWLEDSLNISSRLVAGGVNLDMFRPMESQRNPGAVRLLCSGDPRKRKGFRYIRDAFDIARKAYPELVLLTYHGKGIPQEQMAECYSSADLFLEGSFQAGWNNPVAEAMACKVPVICTDIGGCRDFAFHEQTALLVPPKKPQAMAREILRLVEDSALRESLRNQAYEHIRQYSWDRCVNVLENVIKSELP
jgi:glycosyltransferase involved in cell wall biosynthesis